MDKNELLKIVDEIENGENFSDLTVHEKILVMTKLLNRTINLIDDYMIDTEEDEKYVEELRKAYKILHNILN